METIELIPRLHFLRFAVGNAYLWRDPDGLTLIDSGVPGSAPLIAEAIRGLGHQTSDVRRLVLTHFHEDHVGSAAEIATWGDVTVYAHRAEAPVIRANTDGPQPNFLDWERPLHAQARAQMPDVLPEPVRVDRELDDGDTIEFGGGATAVWVPGHTPGSLSVYLDEHGVLFTGDTIAAHPEGNVILGVFNVDTAEAVASLRRQAALDVEIACFGHGEPVTQDAGSALRAAASTY